MSTTIWTASVGLGDCCFDVVINLKVCSLCLKEPSSRDDGADSKYTFVTSYTTTSPVPHTTPNKDPHMHQSKPSSGHQAPCPSIIVHNTVSQRGTQEQSSNHRTRPHPWVWTESRNRGYLNKSKSVTALSKARKRANTFAISRQLLRNLIPNFCHRRFPPPPLVSTPRRNIRRLYLCPATIHDARLNQLRQLPSSGPKTSMGEGNANNLT